MATDNPHNTEDYINALKSIKNKAKRERLLHGNWEYDDNPYALYDYELLTDCFASADRYSEGYRYITIDVARMGKDYSVIFVWEGWTVLEVARVKKGRLDSLLSDIKALQKKHGVSNSHTIADEDGVGGGLVDFGNIKGFLNGSKAIDGNYANLKTECAFIMAQNLDKVRFEDCQYQEEITEELEVVEETNPDKDDKKITISTRQEMIDKIGRSPDFFSAFLMRGYFDVNPVRPMRLHTPPNQFTHVW